MERKIRFLTVFLLILTLLSVFPIAVGAAQAESGVEYRKSDDGTYIIVTGTTEEFPAIKIESEIEGLPVKEIAPSAFQNNYSLYSIEIPDSVTTIGEAAFRNCRSLVSVKLPSTLKEIPMDAFRDCFVLTSITLPSSLEYIGDFAFQGCKKLGRLYIPASVKELGYDVFMECESIELKVGDNPYAAEYAKNNFINTEFSGTGKYFFLLMGAATAALFAVVFLVIFIVKKLHRGRGRA